VLLDPKRRAEDPAADDVDEELAAARPALHREAVARDAELGRHLVAVEQLWERREEREERGEREREGGLREECAERREE
tara:strand:+ start:408 stop:644 length:237 start_codon:yes stop_codon:yes gene_type:complete